MLAVDGTTTGACDSDESIFSKNSVELEKIKIKRKKTFDVLK